MPEAPRPPDETARLEVLRAYDILDTPAEPSFDRLGRLASRILGTPMALVTLVDDERQWFKSRLAFDVAETSRAASFCAWAVAERAMVVVPDTSVDARFRDNPFVQGAPGIRFYAGAPLTTPGGFVLGTLCGLDTVPHPDGLSDVQREQLSDLAALVVDELELRRSVRLLAEQQRQLEVVTLATEAASDAILITDATPISSPDGPRIVYANQAFLDMSGYDRADVIGRTPRLLQGPQADPAALARIRDAIQAGRQVREELLDYRKDGTPYWVEVRIAPVVAHDSEAPQLVFVQRDATLRHAPEEDLRRHVAGGDATPSAPTVVVADDEAPLRKLLALTLERSGYHVLEARNGREAIDLCRRLQVDLLLTDLVMPEQEGLETIRQLRADLPHVRVVAMSGAFDGKFLNVARAFGADAVLQKPFDGRTVLATVSSLIGVP